MSAVKCKLLLYPDDSALVVSGKNVHDIESALGSELGEVSKWLVDNKLSLHDLIQYYKETNQEGILLLIDFEKAFDSIEWSFIKKVLHTYMLGPDFMKWIDVIYHNSQSCVINNGHYSEFFDLGRGCRQADPLSPNLFLLCIEPLAKYIESCSDIKGIMFGNKEIKLCQYADDTRVFK